MLIPKNPLLDFRRWIDLPKPTCRPEIPKDPPRVRPPEPGCKPAPDLKDLLGRKRKRGR